MPPSGNLYGVPVYVESELARQDTLAFHAGTHGDVIYMRFTDFRRTVGPMVLSFARSEDVPQLATNQWYGGRQP